MADTFFAGFVFGTVFWILVLLMLVHETWRRINMLEGLLFRLLRSIRKAYRSEDDIRALADAESYRIYQECANAIRSKEVL